MTIIHEHPEHTHPVGIEDRLEAYERDGFVILPSILDPVALARIHHEMAPLLAASPLGRNDFEGFARSKGFASAKPEHQEGRAVLTLSR